MADINELREKIQGLSEAQLEQISGGECTVKELIGIFNNMTETYENLIDFTSYVIERVVGP